MLRTLREITEIKELIPTLVNSLIERIEVHNNDKSVQSISELHRGYYIKTSLCGVGIEHAVFCDISCHVEILIAKSCDFLKFKLVMVVRWIHAQQVMFL